VRLSQRDTHRGGSRVNNGRPAAIIDISFPQNTVTKVVTALNIYVEHSPSKCPLKLKFSFQSDDKAKLTRLTQIKQTHFRKVLVPIPTGTQPPCGCCKDRRYGGMYRLHHQGKNNQRTKNRFEIVSNCSKPPPRNLQILRRINRLGCVSCKVRTVFISQKTTFFIVTPMKTSNLR
jgi:hypothetical protein